MVESESDGLSLDISNDRDSIYVYASEESDGGAL